MDGSLHEVNGFDARSDALWKEARAKQRADTAGAFRPIDLDRKALLVIGGEMATLGLRQDRTRSVSVMLALRDSTTRMKGQRESGYGLPIPILFAD